MNKKFADIDYILTYEIRMKTIRKKVLREYFEFILSGKKKFELRLGDFDINEGDTLILEEWDTETQEYTGRNMEVVASYIFKTKGQTFWPQEKVEKHGFQVIQFEPKTEKKFHLCVRAIIHDGNYLLVVRKKGEKYCFLPGGHHEIGESLAAALKRELKEELGVENKVKKYLGLVENCWIEHGVYQYEINHVFEVDALGLNAKYTPRSLEDHLEFFWITPDDFKRENFLPVIMRSLLMNWLKGDQKIWYEKNFA